MSEFEKVSSVQDFPATGRLATFVDDRAILVLRVAEKYYAIEDVCTHDGQPLTNGPVSGCEITCPRHGARFDIVTGKPLCMPATAPIPRFAVKVEQGDIFVGAEL